MASVSRMRSNEPIEISDDDSDENEDQLDRENDSFGKFIFVKWIPTSTQKAEVYFFNQSSCSWLFTSTLKITRFLKISLDDLFGDSDDDENMYVDGDIPQRRSAVLAPVRVHVDNNMRVSVAINGTRNSVNSILNAQMAARNVAADLARKKGTLYKI